MGSKHQVNDVEDDDHGGNNDADVDDDDYDAPFHLHNYLIHNV